MSRARGNSACAGLVCDDAQGFWHSAGGTAQTDAGLALDAIVRLAAIGNEELDLAMIEIRDAQSHAAA